MMKYIKNRYVIFVLCLILAGVIAFVIVPKSNKNMAESVDVAILYKALHDSALLA